MNKKKTINFIKIITIIIISHGLICITMSYILAWMGKTDVLETLSGVLASEIVAPVITYGTTKTIENIFEKNKTKWSEPINQGDEL